MNNKNSNKLQNKEQSSVTAYKFLTSGRDSITGNSTNNQNILKSRHGNIVWTPGEWQVHSGELKICESGFHACERPLDSLNYTYGNYFSIVEASGRIIHGKDDNEDKFVSSRMRVIRTFTPEETKEIMVRFAIACAKNCLFRFEQKYLYDDRPRKAIEAVERYMRGEISIEELKKAKNAADADAADDADDAADADRKSERKWQNKKLEQIIVEYR